MDAARAAALLDLHGADCYNAQAIERAWKRNLLKNHPDKNTSAQATERTQAANEAKEVLLKPLQAIDEKAEKKAYWAEMNRRYDEIRQRETAAMMEEHRKTEEARQLKKEAAAERKRKREAAAKIHENADNTRAELQALKLDYQEKALEIQRLRQERQELHTVKQEKTQEIQGLRQELQELHTVKQEKTQEIQGLRQELQELHSVKQAQAQEIQGLRQERQELRAVKQEQAQEIKALKQGHQEMADEVQALKLECLDSANAVQQLLSDCTLSEIANTLKDVTAYASKAHGESLALQQECNAQAAVILELRYNDTANNEYEPARNMNRKTSRSVHDNRSQNAEGATLKKRIKIFVTNCIISSSDDSPMLSIKTIIVAFKRHGYGICTAHQLGKLLPNQLSAQHPSAKRIKKTNSRGYIGIALKNP
jgi:chromosome segregation ATPase